MKYRCKRVSDVVDAERIEVRGVVNCQGVNFDVGPGDWVITFSDGFKRVYPSGSVDPTESGLGPVKASPSFEDLYEPVPEYPIAEDIQTIPARSGRNIDSRLEAIEDTLADHAEQLAQLARYLADCVTDEELEGRVLAILDKQFKK